MCALWVHFLTKQSLWSLQMTILFMLRIQIYDLWLRWSHSLSLSLSLLFSTAAAGSVCTKSNNLLWQRDYRRKKICLSEIKNLLIVRKDAVSFCRKWENDITRKCIHKEIEKRFGGRANRLSFYNIKITVMSKRMTVVNVMQQNIIKIKSKQVVFKREWKEIFNLKFGQVAHTAHNCENISIQSYFI